MATITKIKGGVGSVLHVEADGCVVNIREGLSDDLGRRMTSVEVLPDHPYEGSRWTTRPKIAHVQVVRMEAPRRREK